MASFHVQLDRQLDHFEIQVVAPDLEPVDALIYGPNGKSRLAILVELRIKLSNSCREMLNPKRLGSLSQHSVDSAKVVSNTVQEVHPSDHFWEINVRGRDACARISGSRVLWSMHITSSFLFSGRYGLGSEGLSHTLAGGLT